MWNKTPFGYKYILIQVCSIILAVSYLAIVYLFLQDDYSDMIKSAMTLGIYGTIIWFAYHAFVEKKWMRVTTITSVEKTLEGLGVILLLIGFLFIFRFGKEIYQFHSFERVTLIDTWDDLALIAIFTFGLTTIILLAIPEIFYRVEIAKQHYLFRQFKHGQGGSAKWAGPATYQKMQMVYDTNQKTNHIFLGRNLVKHDPKVKNIGIKNTAHNCTIGMIGSGKYTTVLMNQLNKYKGTVVCIDPKGELAESTFASRDRFSSVHVVDPFNITNTPISYYNPLDEIDINAPNARRLIEVIANSMVDLEGSKDQHFSETAVNIIQGFIAYTKYAFPQEKQNLFTVYQLMMEINPETNFIDKEYYENTLVEMAVCDVAGGITQIAAQVLISVGDNERGSHKSTALRAVKWISDPQISDFLQKPSDFKFCDVGIEDTPHSIYLVVPLSRIQEYKRWLRILINVSVTAMRERQTLPEVPTLMLMDEFSQLGRLKEITNGIATLRSERIKLWPFFQNISQIKEAFAEEWSTFMANSNVQVFGVGTGDLSTSEWLSKSVGMTLDERGRPRPLLSPAEITALLGANSNKQIVLLSEAPKGLENLPLLLERLTFKKINNNFREFRQYS